MRNISRILTLFMFGSMTAGCGPLPDLRLFVGDLQSPIYLGADAVAPATIEILFQEPVRSNSFEISPDIGLLDVDDVDSKIVLRLASPMIPGSQYLLSGSVYDGSGNTLKFTTKLFGFNPATCLINNLPETFSVRSAPPRSASWWRGDKWGLL